VASPERPVGAAIPTTMRSVRLHRPGGPEALALERIPVPHPRAGEALVRVHAAAITRDELQWPLDRLPATPSYELSGVVAALGQGVDGVTIGEPVYALTGFDRDGVAADYAAVPAGLLAPRPRSLGHIESAATPLAALSAWQGLFVHGALEQGQRVLVHGGAGGVGQFAIQLARHRGAQVIATSSPATADLVRELGADQVLDGTTPGFEDAVEPVDLVFDTVGGDRLARSPAVVRDGGRLVSIAEEPPVSRAAIETRYFVVEPDRGQLIELGRLIDRGVLRVAIDSVFALEDARAAFKRSLAAGKRGKVVLRVADDEAAGASPER
jgi:NADPH:quinone reductase-like Zn-dependent oxidoreductase